MAERRDPKPTRMETLRQQRAETFFARTIPAPETGCLLWTSTSDRAGYGFFSVGRKMYRAHRFAWLISGREIPPGMCVCHKCDTPACVNVDHLFIGTHGDNAADKVRKGRHSKEESHGAAILTAAEVLAIRESPESHREIAERLGVRSALVADVRRFAIWKNIHPRVEVDKSKWREVSRSPGERNGSARLTDAQIAEMRRLRAAGHRVKDLAATYGIHRVYASFVCSGKKRAVADEQQKRRVA